MRKIEVQSYKNEWPILYKQEEEKLNEILHEEIINLYHIGSTAVPGLHAKPILDILIVVREIDRMDEYDDEMTNLGYEGKGENGIKGRRYFQKGGDDRTHHVHIYERNNPEISRHILFRDFLRKHPEEAKRYGELKEHLATQYPYDIEAYIQGKDSFVKELEKKAVKWKKLLK